MPERARVIAGLARGLRLDVPPSGTRPLADRVKQALFSTLEAHGALNGPFLDLFAGSGAAGIEALSRGAPAATFVERDGRACSVIRTNLSRTGLNGGQVVCDDVLRYLARGVRDGAAYSAVLADPPYQAQPLKPVLESLAEPPGWLADDCLVVAKHFWREPTPAGVGRLRLGRQRRFGETMLSFYTADEEER